MKLLNYTQEAIPQLQKSVKKYSLVLPKLSAETERLISIMNKAQKFVLPEHGKIMNDGLKGIPRDLKLPYPTILLEYSSKSYLKNREEKDFLWGKDTFDAEKRIVVVVEKTNGTIEIYPIYHTTGSSADGWGVSPWKARLIKSETPSRIVDIKQGFEVYANFKLEVGAVAGKWFSEDIVQGNVESFKKAYNETSNEVYAVFELLEALSCSNVSTRKFQNKTVNKNKKEPYKDYIYHALAVDTNIDVFINNGETRENLNSRSPREHLRRGHIRNYSSGKKIWINSMIVNPGVGGKVFKDYLVA